MAGIGVRLTHIFEKNTLGMNLVGYAYSINSTIMPMLVVIGNIMLMNYVFDISTEGFASRELFSCTILYTFIFGLLSCSPWNAVISRYLSDVIFEERYEDIVPCFDVGLIINIATSAVLGIPFCLHEWLVGGVAPWYVFTGYLCYTGLVLVFYSMIYLSICKDYGKISLFFFIGMALGFLLSWVLINVVHWDKMYSMLCGMAVGFAVTAVLEIALIRSYFRVSSKTYRPLLQYLKKHWQLVLGNFLYTLGLYVHNFVFWTADQRMVVAKSFVCNQPYDMATCLAMFTSLSASTIFIVLIEMRFHDRYRDYFNSVIGGSLYQIDKARNRMFRSITSETMGIARIQFIVSVIAFVFFMLIAPRFGMSSLTMQIYPLLAGGYYIIFLMYAFIILLYYFSDHTGLLLTTATFAVVTGILSIPCKILPAEWHGLGVWAGAFTGWIVSYMRLKWVDKHLDAKVFCEGLLIPRGRGVEPSSVAYSDGHASGVKVGQKKVLFVINTMSRAGAETALIAMLKRLNDPSISIDIYVLMDQGELIPVLPDYVHMLNVQPSLKSVLSPDGRTALKKTTFKRLLARGTGFRNLSYIVTNYMEMRKVGNIQLEKLLWKSMADGAPRFDTTYDLAIAYLEGGSAYYVANHVHAKKKVAWIHTDYITSGYTRKLDQDCYNVFDQIFCVASEIREKFLEVYPELEQKTAIFENLLDKESIQSKSTLPGGFKDDYQGMRLLTLGRLTEEKGFDVAIQAMSILKDRGIEARWYVLGEGDVREELEELIVTLGLEDTFFLLGATDNPYPYLRQCDLYVHITRYEGKSIAIREAQMLGKPIIASDCTGNRETIENGVDGILCDFNPEASADAIELLLKDSELRARYAAASLVRSQAEDSDLYKLYELLGMREIWDADYEPVVPHGRTYAGQDFGVITDRLDEFELEHAYETELRRQKSASSGKSRYEGS